MTIPEIQSKRREAEAQILAIINDFNKATGCNITSIDIYSQEVATEVNGAFARQINVCATVSL